MKKCLSLFLSFLMITGFIFNGNCLTKTAIAKASSAASYNYDAGTLLDSFENIAAWSCSTRGTKSADTVNTQISPHSLRLSVNDPGEDAFIDKTCNLDFSGLQTLSFWVYIPDKSNLLSITAELTPDNFNSDFSACVTKWSLTTGWNHVRFAKSDFSNSGTASWDKPMTTIRLWIFSDSGQKADVSFDELRENEKSTPQIMVVMDDGYSSVYNKMYPYFKDKNIPVSACIVKNLVNTDDYISEAQLKELYNNGWDIFNHTTAHSTLTALTDTQIADELTTCSTYLNSLGFTRSSNILAYPEGLGADSLHIQSAAQNSGIVMARSTINGFINTPIDNKMSLKCALELVNTTTLSDIKTTIDKAIESGSTAIIFGHQITDYPGEDDTYTVSTSVMKGLADYIKGSGIQPITLSSFEFQQSLAKPTISSNFNKTSFTTSNNISIPYTIASANTSGNFIASYTIDGTSKISNTLTSGNNTWNVGKLGAGKHKLQAIVKDSTGLSSNVLNFNISVISLIPIDKKGLILWLDGSDGTGKQKIWNDISGNNNNFTLLNFNYDNDSGWQEDSLKFDGINDYCLSQNSKKLKIKGRSMTIEYVLKQTSDSINTTMTKKQLKSDTSAIISRSTSLANNQSIIKPINVADNVKHYVACRIRNGRIDVWVDSQLKSTVYDSRLLPDNINISMIRNPIFCNDNFKGNIYTIRVYNRALSDKEIMNNYNLS